MSAEAKPLAVGDRVRRREAMVVTTISDGLVWTDGGTVWCPSEVERIDPAPPAAEIDDERVAHWVAAISTLTAERDAARAEVERLRAESDAEADEYAEQLALATASLAAERDAARRETLDLQRALAIALEWDPNTQRDPARMLEQVTDVRAALTYMTEETDRERARAEKAEANYRFTVERAADQKLDGYRDLAGQVLAATVRAEKAEAELVEERAKRERLIASLRENLDSYPSAVIGRAALDEIIAASEATR